VLTLGIDVGGSKLIACALDDSDRVVDETRQETGRATSPAELVRRVAELVWRLRSKGHAPAAIGVGIPGLCDRGRGVVRSSIMLDGWHDVPLAADLARATGLPCVLDNDVNAAALAEATRRCLDDELMLFVAIGTGIGGAITLGRSVWRGASGVAGEIGNLVVDRGGPRCWCGRRGCLNALASGSAIERSAGIPEGTLAARWAAGDPDVRRAVEDAARALAVGLGNAINLLNPALLVLGGGVAQLGAPWLALVRRQLAGEAFAEARAACRVELAQSGYEAGALGAALIARTAVAAVDLGASAPERVA
jgi:glucokinase